MAEIDRRSSTTRLATSVVFKALKTADLGVVGSRLWASEVTGSFGRC